MLVIHVEKALTRYHGIYPVMYSGFVRLVAEQCGIPLKLVNREDDSGDEGLRNSKLQYKPCGMVRKYLVHVRTPAAYVKEYPVLTDGVVVLDQIRENDKRAYRELNTDIENNRYWGYDYREDVMFTGPPDEDTFYTSLMNDMRAGDSMNFAVRLKGHDEMIGEVLLWQFTSDGRAEAGCRIASAYHGHGYGKRAFSLLTEYGQKQMQLQVHARCYHENHASYVMITSSGFKESGQDETFVYFEKTD
jgi:RimJ/RimL family protein N-acetyltransferase